MEALLLLFMIFSFTKQIVLNTYTINDQTPLIIEQTFNAGESIIIKYSKGASYLAIIGKPKFYINLQLTSQRKFHSTTPGLYALGESGGVEYTAIVAGTHKIFAWMFSYSKCQYVVAKGKQAYNQNRDINPNYWAFIETDPDEKMNIQSDGLESYTFVHLYDGEKCEVINSEYGSFSKTNLRLVLVQSTNKNPVKVTISSQGNTEYDYGEYNQAGLTASTVPFFYTSQDKKQNMLDDYYDPDSDKPTDPIQDSGNKPTDPIQDSGNKQTDPIQETGSGDDNSDGDSKDGGLSTGAKAGIGAGAGVAGGGTIAAIVVAIVKHVQNNKDDSGKEMEMENNLDNSIENKNDIKNDIKAGGDVDLRNNSNTCNCCNCTIY